MRLAQRRSRTGCTLFPRTTLRRPRGRRGRSTRPCSSALGQVGGIDGDPRLLAKDLQQDHDPFVAVAGQEYRLVVLERAFEYANAIALLETAPWRGEQSFVV